MRLDSNAATAVRSARGLGTAMRQRIASTVRRHVLAHMLLANQNGYRCSGGAMVVRKPLSGRRNDRCNNRRKPDQAEWIAANALGCFENIKEHGHAMCILASYPVGRVRGFKVDESGAVRW